MNGEPQPTTIPQEITLETLVILAEMGREKEVQKGVATLHLADIAELINALEEAEVKSKVFSFLATDAAPQVLSLVSRITRREIVQDLPETYLQQILERLDSDDAVDLLGSLPQERIQALLERVSKPLSAEIQQLLLYPTDTAGGIMQTEYMAVPEGTTVEQAIEIVRGRAKEVEDIHNIFIVDHHLYCGSSPPPGWGSSLAQAYPGPHRRTGRHSHGPAGSLRGGEN